MLIATADIINELKPFAKILGPKGLMPNSKVGTLVTIDKLGIYTMLISKNRMIILNRTSCNGC